MPPVQDVRVVNKPTEVMPTAAQGVTAVAGHVTIDNEPTVHVARPGVEYRIDDPPNLGNPGAAKAMVAALNQLGKQGWQFVEFVASDTANHTAGLFKRTL